MVINWQKYSSSAQSIIRTGVGYRNVYDTSGITDFATVLDFETGELGNKDIYLTLRNVFGYKLLDLRKSHKTLNMLVQQYICHYFMCGIDKLKCVWLCSTIAEVENMYGCEDIRQIFLPNEYMIVSDLGYDGVLVVSPYLHF